MNWPEIARQIGQGGLAPRQNPVLWSLLQQHQQDPCWAVACSGGADSVYLLLWLWHHFFQHGQPNGIVLHYNHRVRGADADEDQAWVEQLAAALDLRCFSQRSERANPLQAGEAGWRQERMTFFHQVLQAQRVKLLFTGHQAEDVAEWMMMRLARGSNAGGLSGPRPIQYWKSVDLVHVRPLLDMRRQELREQLLRAGAQWREDRTNHQALYQRNQLRLQVLPQWEKASTAPLVPGLLRSRKLLAEDDDALWQELGRRTTGWDWQSHRLQWQHSWSAALLRRAWLCWGRCHPILLDRGRVWQDQVIENTLYGKRRQKYTLAEGIYLYVSSSEWQLVDERSQQPARWKKRYPLQPGSSLHIPGHGVLSCRPLSREDCELLLGEGFPDPEKRQYRAWLQGDALQQGLWVRLLRRDDVIQPIGRKRAYPVHELLKKRGLSEQERQQVFVVYTSDQRLVWVSGLPSAVHFKLEQEDKYALALEFIPHMGYL